MKKAPRYSEVALLSLFATACSGGGGSSHQQPMPATPNNEITPNETLDTTEKANSVTEIFSQTAAELTEKITNPTSQLENNNNKEEFVSSSTMPEDPKSESSSPEIEISNPSNEAKVEEEKPSTTPIEISEVTEEVKTESEISTPSNEVKMEEETPSTTPIEISEVTEEVKTESEISNPTNEVKMEEETPSTTPIEISEVTEEVKTESEISNPTNEAKVEEEKPSTTPVEISEVIEEVKTEPEISNPTNEAKVEEEKPSTTPIEISEVTEEVKTESEISNPSNEVKVEVEEEKPSTAPIEISEVTEEVKTESEISNPSNEAKVEEETPSTAPIEISEVTEEVKTEPEIEVAQENKPVMVTEHIEPTGMYLPKDPTRIFDEAAKFTQNGMIEKLSPLNNVVVNDENLTHKIGVIDVDFSAKNDTGKAFQFSNGENRLLLNYDSPRQAKGNKHSHGTMAAGVIALKNEKGYIYGYTADSNNMVSASNQYYEAAYAQGVRIFNNSYGNTPWESRLKEKGGWRYFAQNPIYEMLAKMAAQDSIFVWAAGNDGQSKHSGQNKYATTESHIPVLNDDARRGWITVAAVDWRGQNLMSYSSQIGETAKNWGIATQGEWSLFDNSVSTTGTSFAAPVVTAAVANVWDKFPWMSNHLVTQTILSTANKLGSTEVTTDPNEKVGWGVLNEARALKGPARFDKRLLVKSDNGFVTADFAARNYQDRSRLTWSNDIAGDAGFRKLGTGTLYFSGYNTYSGQTIVENGTLSLSNALINSAVRIEKNGTLRTENDTQAVKIGQSVANNGSFEVYGKGVNIDGDYQADKDARTVIDIDTALLNVKGKADLQNSRILADVANINEVPTQNEKTRTILKAGSLINYGNFYTVSDHIAPYILVSKVEQQENEVKATYKRNKTANVLRSVGALSRSAENTGENLDKVFDEVAQTPNSKIKSDSLAILTAAPLTAAQTVESLAAEIYASAQNMLLNENRVFSQNIADRAFQNFASENSNVYGAITHQTYRIAQTGYKNAKISGNQTYLGADKQIGDLLVGAAIYHSYQKADFEQTTGTAKLNQQGGTLYAGYQKNSGYILAQAGMAQAKNEVKRTLLLPNETRSLATDVKSRLYSVYTELGYRFALQPLELSPFIGYQLDSIYQKAFDEQKNFGVQADRTKFSLNSYLAGLRATMKLGDLSLNALLSHRITPNAKDAFNFDARYIGAESNIHLQGISPAKNITTAKIGLGYKITENFDLFGEYAIAYPSSGEKWQNVSLGAKYRF